MLIRPPTRWSGNVCVLAVHDHGIDVSHSTNAATYVPYDAHGTVLLAFVTSFVSYRNLLLCVPRKNVHEMLWLSPGHARKKTEISYSCRTNINIVFLCGRITFPAPCSRRSAEHDIGISYTSFMSAPLSYFLCPLTTVIVAGRIPTTPGEH